MKEILLGKTFKGFEQSYVMKREKYWENNDSYSIITLKTY
jgi:hypothetical protein